MDAVSETSGIGAAEAAEDPRVYPGIDPAVVSACERWRVSDGSYDYDDLTHELGAAVVEQADRCFAAMGYPSPFAEPEMCTTCPQVYLADDPEDDDEEEVEEEDVTLTASEVEWVRDAVTQAVHTSRDELKVLLATYGDESGLGILTSPIFAGQTPLDLGTDDFIDDIQHRLIERMEAGR